MKKNHPDQWTKLLETHFKEAVAEIPEGAKTLEEIRMLWGGCPEMTAFKRLQKLEKAGAVKKVKAVSGGKLRNYYVLL